MRDLIERLKERARQRVTFSIFSELKVEDTEEWQAAAKLARLSEGRGLPSEPEELHDAIIRQSAQQDEINAIDRYIDALRAECIARGEALERMVEWPDVNMTKEEVIRVKNTGSEEQWPKVWNVQLAILCDAAIFILEMRAATMKGKG